MNDRAALQAVGTLTQLDFVAFDASPMKERCNCGATNAALAGTVMHKCLQLACAGLGRGHSNRLAR